MYLGPASVLYGLVQIVDQPLSVGVNQGALVLRVTGSAGLFKSSKIALVRHLPRTRGLLGSLCFKQSETETLLFICKHMLANKVI